MAGHVNDVLILDGDQATDRFLRWIFVASVGAISESRTSPNCAESGIGTDLYQDLLSHSLSTRLISFDRSTQPTWLPFRLTGRSTAHRIGIIFPEQT